MNTERIGFRDSTRLTTWVRYLLYAQMVVAVISMVSGEMEYRLLSDFQSGRYTSETEAVAAGETSDERQAVVAALYFVIFIISGVLILTWIYRANYNARQLGASGMTFSPAWSIGWYFVPIATLWKPYQAMKEIWRASQSPSDLQSVQTSGLLPWWWLMWLASNFLGQAVFRASLRAEEIDELMLVNRLSLVSDVTDVPLAVITLALVNGIYRAQMARVKASGLQAVASNGEA